MKKKVIDSPDVLAVMGSAPYLSVVSRGATMLATIVAGAEVAGGGCGRDNCMVLAGAVVYGGGCVREEAAHAGRGPLAIVVGFAALSSFPLVSPPLSRLPYASSPSHQPFLH